MTAAGARRQLDFRSIDDILKDLDALEKAHAAGRLRSVGEWSPGQNLQHLARSMKAPLDGFPPVKPRFYMKLMARMFKGMATSGKAMKPGFKMPRELAVLAPDAQVSFEQGAREFRELLHRVKRGDRMEHPSPYFGRMTHDEWTRLSLGHAMLHMSFLVVDPA